MDGTKVVDAVVYRRLRFISVLVPRSNLSHFVSRGRPMAKQLAPAKPVPYNGGMRQLYLRDCQAGDLIEDVYVITNKQLAAGSNGKQYIKGFIADRSATVTARMWNATREVFLAIPDGGFLRIRAR